MVKKYEPGSRDRDAVNNAVSSWWPLSLASKEKRIAWWRQARFGCFVHWGVYSLAGGRWNDRPSGGYAEHLMRKEKISLSEYIERLVEPFNPVNFDADQWIRLVKEAGMKYFIITAKHHDGFAMYPSDAYPYDIRLTQFKRDPMQELKEACEKYNIKFGFYYSHAFDWEHPDAPGNDWDYENPGGDHLLHGGRDWYDKHPAMLQRVAENYVDGKSIPQILELLKNYEPDILWFDTPHKLPLSENLRILEAIRKADPQVVVNGRLARGMGYPTFSDYINTADRPHEVYPQDGDWEAIPTTNESYGYSIDDNSHKKPGELVQLIAKSAARGGNMLLNVGPMGDGGIDPRDITVLEGLGKWFAVNGASICATRRTPLEVQSWGESTAKDNGLYLHVFKWPKDGKLILGGLYSHIKKAYFLADPHKSPLHLERINYYDWVIKVPANPADEYDTVLVLEIDGTPCTRKSRLLCLKQDNVLRVFDAEISAGIRYGDGKINRDYIHNWTDTTQQIRWRIRLNEPANFLLKLKYAVDETSHGGGYRITVGNQAFEGQIADEQTGGPKEITHELLLNTGEYDLVVCATELIGAEFVKLYNVSLS